MSNCELLVWESLRPLCFYSVQVYAFLLTTYWSYCSPFLTWNKDSSNVFPISTSSTHILTPTLCSSFIAANPCFPVFWKFRITMRIVYHAVHIRSYVSLYSAQCEVETLKLDQSITGHVLPSENDNFFRSTGSCQLPPHFQRSTIVHALVPSPSMWKLPVAREGATCQTHGTQRLYPNNCDFTVSLIIEESVDHSRQILTVNTTADCTVNADSIASRVAT